MKNNNKSNEAYKTIGEVAKELNLVDNKTGSLQTHTIRYWETQFKEIKPIIRVNKKLEGSTGTIFIGSEDPFIYFPDMMSYLEREEITEVKLKARGKSISNAVSIAEQFKNRFKV